MSKAAQEMQRIADEMKKARRQPTTKGRHAVNDELEDVTDEQPTPAQEPAAAPPAAAEEITDMAKSASAIRSAKWRANKKKKAGAAKTKTAKRTAAAPAAGDKASIKAQGSGDVKTVFVTTTVAMARRAFTALMEQAAPLQASEDAAVASENAAVYAAAKKIVDRLA